MFSSLRSFGEALKEGVREFSEQLNDDTDEVRREVKGSLAGANERLGHAVRNVGDSEALGRLADSMSVSRLASKVEGALANPDGVVQNFEGMLNRAEGTATALFASGVRMP